MCLAGSRDILYLLTELAMFTDWFLKWRHRILQMNLVKYALSFKSLLKRYAWLKNAFILVFTLGFRVVELQSLPDLPAETTRK